MLIEMAIIKHKWTTTSVDKDAEKSELMHCGRKCKEV
jgi:hypothetical protein